MPIQEPPNPPELPSATKDGPSNPDLGSSSWKTTSLILATLATMATLLGPITAWVNGAQDRELQQRKTQDEISFKYMDLLLHRSQSVEERRFVLDFLKKALTAKQRDDLMLQVVDEELAKIDLFSSMNNQLKEARQRVAQLEAYSRKSDALVNKYEGEIASLQGSNYESDASTELRAQLEQERQVRKALEQRLASEQSKVSDLQAKLDDQQDEIGANTSESPSAKEEVYTGGGCLICDGVLVCGTDVSCDPEGDNGWEIEESSDARVQRQKRSP